MKRYTSTQLDAFATSDLKIIASISQEASDYVKRVLGAFGNEAAEDALDALWSLGINLNPSLFQTKERPQWKAK